MTPTIEDLQEQVAYLKERLGRLTGSPDQHEALRIEFGLSPKQAGTLALMLNTGRPISTETIYANVFEHHDGGGPDTPIVRVCVSQLRRKLESFKAPPGISSAYGTGCYQMTPDLRAWVQARLQPREIAA